jgi:hypothetical protein
MSLEEDRTPRRSRGSLLHSTLLEPIYGFRSSGVVNGTELSNGQLTELHYGVTSGAGLYDDAARITQLIVSPIAHPYHAKKDDLVEMMVLSERAGEVKEWFSANGWARAPDALGATNMPGTCGGSA